MLTVGVGIIATMFLLSIVSLVVQIVYICKHVGGKKKKEITHEYYPETVEVGGRVMEAAAEGEIKKQLLRNDADKYNSHNALVRYKKFICRSPLQVKLANMEEHRFNG